jgi:hypothetical protein
LVKYFSDRVSPELHDTAAKKEAFGAWNEAFMHGLSEKLRREMQNNHEQTSREMQEMHDKLHKQIKLEHAVHKKTRGDILVKYFSDRVSPELHDTAAKKEAFGAWNEAFIHGLSEKLRREMQNNHEQTSREMQEMHDKLHKQIKLEHTVHKKTRKDMLVKYFSDRVSPELHDTAAKKEAFGAWHEVFIHGLSENLTQEMQDDREKLTEEMRTNYGELQKQTRREHAVHKKTRGDMLVKYFSDRVSPAVHDVAAKKEAFGAWNEQFIRCLSEK